MAPTTLETLPLDIKKEIMDYIKSYEDLKALCLVSKELHEVAAPVLYREITLPASKLNQALLDCLNTANSNLHQTRHLEIYGVPNQCAYNHKTQGRHLVRLIQAFPKDGLTVFDLNTTSNVPLELSVFLHETHSKLTNHRQHTLLDMSGLGTQPSCSVNQLQNISVIALVFEHIEECDIGRQMLARVRSFKDLSITILGDLIGNHEEAFGTIFADWKAPALARPRLALHRLHLRSSPAISHCDGLAPFLVHALEVSALATLELDGYAGPNKLLDLFSQADMSLKKFVHTHNYSAPYVTLEEMSDGSFRMLETLSRTQSKLEELFLAGAIMMLVTGSRLLRSGRSFVFSASTP
ncbi:uncharacterized protein LTR77_002424 [Saxophila tyrrhenica]|uniref:F-box domain-containing protein n=1 Tax=Saxophila tyrrhenica TaxID=1690608 RepID=A0AAV9PM04_9PEZI|nr:hypothetical protein LTR77_002424 [Saxophila tyrrhenica]